MHGRPLLFVVVLGLMAADLATTAAGLHLGLSEANPFVAAVAGRFGVPGIVGLKAVAAALLVALPTAASRPRAVFVASAGAYGVVQLVAVVSNLLQLWLVVG